MITELSESQISKLTEYRDRWIQIGLCTEPANRDEAEKGIVEAYRIGGMGPPKIVWCGSPLSQGITRAIILNKHIKSVGDSVRDSVWASVWASVGDSVRASVRDSVGASVRDSVWDSVRASVGDSVGASVRASVGASVRDSVWDSVRASVGDSVRASVWDSVRASVWASVGDSVWASVWASVGDSVRDSVWDSVRDSVWASVWASVGDGVRASVWDSVRASCYGQHDANWLGFYEFFREVCRLETQTNKLIGLCQTSKNAGWFLPHAKICWVSERHSRVLQDSQLRVHCETGPAIAYPDGWNIYAYHGVRVPERIIKCREQLSWSDAQNETNAEIRRVIVQLIGAEKMLRESGAKLVHSDDFGTLYSLPDAERRIVKVVNSTPEGDGSFKDYYLFVPPQMERARQAVAWTFGQDEMNYAPAMES